MNLTASGPGDNVVKFSWRVFISCAPEDNAFLHALQTHLSGLESSGLISTWSSSELKPGENVEHREYEEIDRANIVLLLLSADLLSDDSLQRELHYVLKRAATGKVRLVPIRIRPLELEGTPLAGLQTLPDGDAVSQWPNQDAAWAQVSNYLAAVVAGSTNDRKKPKAHASHGHAMPDAHPIGKLPSQEKAQLARLHAKMERFWISGVLCGPPETPIMVPQRRTLEEEWIAGLGTELQTAAPIEVPTDHSIKDLFEESGRSLLLLGQPGTGKTTQLLLLAQNLLNAGPQPVPVIFPLATWTESARSLRAWMTEELCIQYQVPISFAESWLSKGVILPLLDGLDEIPEQLRSRCLEAINKAVEKAVLPGIVVTCRTNEYEVLPHRLRLNAALRLHHLTREMVVDVFARHPALAGLPSEQREQFLGLAQSPLALTLLIHVASDNLPPNDIEVRPGKGQLSSLLDAYIERMVARSGKKKLPVDREKFVVILEHLAFAMRRNNCAVFQLDSLQPGWLEKPHDVWVYAFASRFLAAGVLGSGVILSFGLTPLENQGFKATLGFGVALAGCTTFTVGLLASLIAGWAMRNPPQKRKTGRIHMAHVAALGIVAGAINAAVLGWWWQHSMAAIMGFQIGLVATILLSPHAGIGDRYADIQPREALRFSWAHALRMAPVGIILSLVAFFGASGERELHASIIAATAVLLVALLLGGLRGTEVDEKAIQNRRIERSLQIAWTVSLAGGVLTTVIMAYFYGILYGLCTGLTTLTTLWLWYGGYTAIQHSLVRALLRREKHEYLDGHYRDAAIDRALLYRVGGGCMFINPLFMSHLAERFASRRNGN